MLFSSIAAAPPSLFLTRARALARTHDQTRVPASFDPTDGAAAFLFQGSRQQSSHYRDKTARRLVL
jgi:hypothetical protein